MNLSVTTVDIPFGRSSRPARGSPICQHDETHTSENASP